MTLPQQAAATPHPPPDAGLPIASAMLDSLLTEAAKLASEAHELLAPVAESRDTLRRQLLDDGAIMPIGEPDNTPRSIAAVDGGSVREHLYSADLMVVVAVSAEGMTSTGDQALLHDHWTHVLDHEVDNQSLMSAAMASLELTLLDRLTHDIRFLDGSTTSGIISLSVALNAHNADIADRAAALLSDEVLAAVHSLGDPDHRNHPGHIVALPKSDSSHYFADRFQRDYRLLLPGGDRFIAAQVLEPGEMLYPRHAAEHTHPPTSIPRDADPAVARAARALAEAVAPIGLAASEDRLVVTYLKPETADTVVKAEIHTTEPLRARVHGHPADLTGRAVTEVRTMGRVLSDETPGPFLQEPFAQYAADLAAKNVSVGTEALQQALLAHLPPEAEPYLAFLARSYRTKTAPRAKRRDRSGGQGPS